MRHSDDSGRSVIERVAAVMESLAGTGRPLGLADICDSTGIPRATVHRILGQLIECGLVERTPQGYRGGRRAWSVGANSAYATFRQAAAPWLSRLHRTTRLTVQLGLLDDGQVLYLEKLAQPGDTLPTRVGGRQPLHCTALGRALLAFGDPATFDAVASGSLPARTPRTVTDVAALRRLVGRAAETRVAFEMGEHTEGIGCIAAPVLTPCGMARAAVSLSGPVATVQGKDIRHALLVAAHEISKAAGRRDLEAMRAPGVALVS